MHEGERERADKTRAYLGFMLVLMLARCSCLLVQVVLARIDTRKRALGVSVRAAERQSQGKEMKTDQCASRPLRPSSLAQSLPLRARGELAPLLPLPLVRLVLGVQVELDGGLLRKARDVLDQDGSPVLHVRKRRKVRDRRGGEEEEGRGGEEEKRRGKALTLSWALQTSRTGRVLCSKTMGRRASPRS